MCGGGRERRLLVWLNTSGFRSFVICVGALVSYSPTHKQALLRLKVKEGRNKGKIKKGNGNGKGSKSSLIRMVRRKLTEGMSPSKAVASEQPTESHELICWNYCGLGNPTTINELRQLFTANHLDIIFLCETKLCGCEFDRVCRKSNMNGCFVVDANSQSGGLVVL